MTFKNILATKTNWLHLLTFLILACLLATIMYILILPIAFWIIYGEGQSAGRVEQLPIDIFIGEWIPLIFVLTITGFNIYINILKRDLARVKTHLFGAIAVTVLYLFRFHILNVGVKIFQS